MLKLLGFVELEGLDERTVLRAMELDFSDLEGALVSAAAEKAGADVIVTRNGKDFWGSTVPVMDPKAFLAYIRTNGEKS